MKLKTRWYLFSVLGLLLVGFGLSLLGEAIIYKLTEKPWFLLGTFALVTVNSGLCFVAEAILLKLAIKRQKD